MKIEIYRIRRRAKRTDRQDRDRCREENQNQEEDKQKRPPRMMFCKQVLLLSYNPPPELSNWVRLNQQNQPIYTNAITLNYMFRPKTKNVNYVLHAFFDTIFFCYNSLITNLQLMGNGPDRMSIYISTMKN